MTGSADPAGSQVDDLVRRLRAWNVSSWRWGDRIARTRSTLSVLADLATAHDGRQRPAVPDAGVHALADQLVVLTADARRAGADGGQIDHILDDLVAALGLAGR